MIVIADTGPLNYLVWIGEIEALPVLYGRVLAPPSVCDELKRPRAPEAVRLWIAKPPEWLEVRAPSNPPDEALLQESDPANAMRFCWRSNWTPMS